MTIREISVTGKTALVDVKCVTCGNPNYPMFQMDRTDKPTIISAKRVADEHERNTGGLHRIIIAIVRILNA